MFKLSDGKEIMTLAFFVLIQYRSVTDGRTDGRTDRQTDNLPLALPAVCIARYANALVKTCFYVSKNLFSMFFVFFNVTFLLLLKTKT